MIKNQGKLLLIFRGNEKKAGYIIRSFKSIGTIKIYALSNRF